MSFKILIIITRPFDPNAGGVQRSTYKISSYLKQNGYDTHVYSTYKEGHPPQDVAKLHTALEPGGNANKENFKRLEHIIKELKPDIVLNQMPYEITLGKILKKAQKKTGFFLVGCLRNTLYPVKLNIDKYLNEVVPKSLHPLVNNSTGERILQKTHKVRHTKSLKFILNTYDYFIMFGPPNLEELKYFVGNYKLHKTYFIPNSVLNIQEKLPKKEKRILWLSRLGYKQKRADLILPFWKLICEKLPEWQLDIVGDGNAFRDLKKQIKADNIPRVNMYGRQVPYEYYKRASIYIMTSAFEGFPNTLIEAQSFACAPVVFDSYPICSWVVKNGKSGILIPPFDVEKMASEVELLANDNNKLSLLMNNALENAKEFELQKVGKLWVNFFNSKIEKK